MQYFVEDKIKIDVELTDDFKYCATPYIATPAGTWLKQPTELYNSNEEWLERFKEISDAYKPRQKAVTEYRQRSVKSITLRFYPKDGELYSYAKKLGTPKIKEMLKAQMEEDILI